MFITKHAIDKLIKLCYVLFIDTEDNRMKATKTALKELKALASNKFDITLLLSGGHKLEGVILKIENNIVYLKLDANKYQTHKGWVHINDISGVSYREA